MGEPRRGGDGTEVRYFAVTPSEARLPGRAARHLRGSSAQVGEGGQGSWSAPRLTARSEPIPYAAFGEREMSAEPGALGQAACLREKVYWSMCVHVRVRACVCKSAGPLKVSHFRAQEMLLRGPPQQHTAPCLGSGGTSSQAPAKRRHTTNICPLTAQGAFCLPLRAGGCMQAGGILVLLLAAET